METKSRRSQRRTMLSTGAVVLLLLSWVGMNPAAADAVPPANHESILNALRYAGLSATAGALDNVIWNRGFLVPPSATLLVPTNAAMEPLLASTATDDLVAVISHHIIAQNLPYDALTSLPVGTQLPTMLANDTLLVTDNNPSAFRINYQEVLPADLCTIQTVACYAVNAVLDSDEPGIITATPPIPEILPPAEAPVLPPPRSSESARGGAGGAASGFSAGTSSACGGTCCVSPSGKSWGYSGKSWRCSGGARCQSARYYPRWRSFGGRDGFAFSHGSCGCHIDGYHDLVPVVWDWIIGMPGLKPFNLSAFMDSYIH